MAQAKRKQNGAGSIRAERNRLIVFLRYALDDVGVISQQSAHYLQLAIQTLEDEARQEPTAIGAHEAGGS